MIKDSISIPVFESEIHTEMSKLLLRNIFIFMSKLLFIINNVETTLFGHRKTSISQYVQQNKIVPRVCHVIRSIKSTPLFEMLLWHTFNEIVLNCVWLLCFSCPKSLVILSHNIRVIDYVIF